MPSRTRYQNAFTIVELLIVVVVIAILAAITMVAYRNFSDRAEVAVIASDLTQAAKQLSMDKALTDTFPASKAAANSNKGLSASAGVVYEYDTDGTTFCLSAVKGSRAYHTTQNGSTEEGVCPNHTGPEGGSVATACDGYSVGSAGPAGGTIFYKDTSSAPAKCYEAAPVGWYGGANDPYAEWGCFNVAVPGADSTAIGTGQQNTADIKAADCKPYSTGQPVAAIIASNYAGGGKSDWYLPSSDELYEMYAQKSTVGGLVGGGVGSHWSSSEYSPKNAWRLIFSNNTNNQTNILKMNQFSVRPIRSFSD